MSEVDAGVDREEVGTNPDRSAKNSIPDMENIIMIIRAGVMSGYAAFAGPGTNRPMSTAAMSTTVEFFRNSRPKCTAPSLLFFHRFQIPLRK